MRSHGLGTTPSAWQQNHTKELWLNWFDLIFIPSRNANDKISLLSIQENSTIFNQRKAYLLSTKFGWCTLFQPIWTFLNAIKPFILLKSQRSKSPLQVWILIAAFDSPNTRRLCMNPCSQPETKTFINLIVVDLRLIKDSSWMLTELWMAT